MCQGIDNLPDIASSREKKRLDHRHQNNQQFSLLQRLLESGVSIPGITACLKQVTLTQVLEVSAKDKASDNELLACK